MRVTSKAQYALRALLDLARHEPGNRAVSLADIAARQAISVSYLEQLFARLRKQGLVVSYRGPNGGYRLGAEPAEISVSQVTEAISENMDTTRCHGEGHCQHGATCLTHHLWMDLNEHIQGYLLGITLADVLARGEALDMPPCPVARAERPEAEQTEVIAQAQ